MILSELKTPQSSDCKQVFKRFALKTLQPSFEICASRVLLVGGRNLHNLVISLLPSVAQFSLLPLMKKHEGSQKQEELQLVEPSFTDE